MKPSSPFHWLWLAAAIILYVIPIIFGILVRKQSRQRDAALSDAEQRAAKAADALIEANKARRETDAAAAPEEHKVCAFCRRTAKGKQMLRYRVLLIDTERTGLPVQAFVNNPVQVEDWARAVLATASKGSYVTVYSITENETGTYKQTDFVK